MISQRFLNLYLITKILKEPIRSLRNKHYTFSQMQHVKKYSTDQKNKPKNEEKGKDNLNVAVDSKYKIFHDEESATIYDVHEEQEKLNLEEFNAVFVPRNPFEGLNTKRGVNGVYEIEDLVQILRRDNAQDIFVATVPEEFAYVNYIVIVTGRSSKHMIALATFIRKLYKKKMHSKDIIPKIEGEGSKDWIAIDLGNIALHIFSREARIVYDLETLWSVGSEYDDNTHRKDTNIMDQYNSFLAELEPEENQNNKLL